MRFRSSVVAVRLLVCRPLLQKPGVFAKRLAALEARPLLPAKQFMCLGSFLLRDALAVWIDGGSPDRIRAAAARAHARNQGVPFPAAPGVFATPPAP